MLDRLLRKHSPRSGCRSSTETCCFIPTLLRGDTEEKPIWQNGGLALMKCCFVPRGQSWAEAERFSLVLVSVHLCFTGQ